MPIRYLAWCCFISAAVTVYAEAVRYASGDFNFWRGIFIVGTAAALFTAWDALRGAACSR